MAIYSSGNARRSAERRTARSTRVALLVAAGLLVSSVGTALAVDRSPAPPRAAAPSPAPTAAALDECRPAAATAGSIAVTTTIDKPRYALPAGWIWYGDATGLAVAVPAGWTRTAAGTSTCFRDPAGGRSFGVDTAVRFAGSRAAYLDSSELGELTDGRLPGYEAVGTGSLQLRQGAADWEFRWHPAGGPPLHERQVLLSMGQGRTYLVTWTTRDTDWSINEPNQQLILASIG